MENYMWYQELIKPSWAPPSWVFNPLWTILYLLIAISFGYVIYLWFKKEVDTKTLLPFVLNILFNVLFTPIQFGLQNLKLAAVDVVLVWVTLAWAMIVVYRKAKWVAYINIPYLLWVSFATVLQLTITFLNW